MHSLMASKRRNLIQVFIALCPLSQQTMNCTLCYPYPPDTVPSDMAHGQQKLVENGSIKEWTIDTHKARNGKRHQRWYNNNGFHLSAPVCDSHRSHLMLKSSYEVRHHYHHFTSKKQTHRASGTNCPESNRRKWYQDSNPGGFPRT